MSKVKIQGNASGTGVLTVTAPNTSTDRTITLPDSTGTLATTADVPSSITDNGDATAITIDSSERVGIGTGSPSEPLHVAGSGNSTKIRIQNTKSGTTTGAELEMVSEDGTWQLGQGRGSLHDGDDEDFHIYNSGTKLWIKKTNGNVYIPSGNLVLGSGLTIGGTGAANTLDDYEEGTFTATLTSSTPPTNPPTATGNYTKVGDWVHFSIFRFANVDTSGASGEMKITGLPFTVGTNSITTNFATHHFNFDTSKYQWGEIYSTQISFLESQNGGAWQNWSITAGTGKYLSISGSYRV